MAGSFSTSRKVKIKLKKPEFNVVAHIPEPFHVTAKNCNYDVICGRDFLQVLGIQLD